MSLHTQSADSDTQAWMCTHTLFYLMFFWVMMMTGIKIEKHIGGDRGIMWYVIWNTQSLGATILSPRIIYSSTLHRLPYTHFLSPLCDTLCMRRRGRESHHWRTAVLSPHRSSQAVERWQFDQVELKDVSTQLYLDICLLSDCVALLLIRRMSGDETLIFTTLKQLYRHDENIPTHWKTLSTKLSNNCGLPDSASTNQMSRSQNAVWQWTAEWMYYQYCVDNK